METASAPTRTERLEKLKMHFLNELVEDPINGTLFDCDVLEAIKQLEEKWKR